VTCVATQAIAAERTAKSGLHSQANAEVEAAQALQRWADEPRSHHADPGAVAQHPSMGLLACCEL
jgi:hypothetical protein